MDTQTAKATPTDTITPTARLPRHAPRAAGALLGALFMAEWLLFDHWPGGVALAGMTLTVFGASWSARPRSWRRTAGPLFLVLVTVLPLLDYLQALSFWIAFFGLLVALAWLQANPRDWLTLLAQIPIAAPRDLIRGGCAAGQMGQSLPAPRAVLSTWALPVAGASLLLLLMLEANPLLSGWLSFDLSGLDLSDLYWRAILWGGTAFLIWPMVLGLTGRGRGPRGVRVIHLPGINHASVTRALWVFNLLLAVQTLTDASILWAGANLPEGMSYATYAHRGAYPLLATALLAIAFAVLARPHLDRPVLRWLLVLWLLQNLALTLSAGLRLSIYVEAFGLTYLRLHAAIWMSVVAAGLGLALWQVARDRSTEWLVLRGAVLAGATLYACAFVNFSAIIADLTTERYAAGQKIDTRYLCRLPETASAAILAAEDYPDCRAPAPHIRGWRDWGFREARVRSKLAAMKDSAQ